MYANVDGILFTIYYVLYPMEKSPCSGCKNVVRNVVRESFVGSLFGTLFGTPSSDRCSERCSDPVSASPVFLMTVSWAQSSNPQSSEPQSSESQSSELRASELRALFNVVRKLIRCSDPCLTLFEALFVVVRAWLWPFPLFEENINNCESKKNEINIQKS